MNNPICSCIFIKKSQTKFEIIIVYIDDLNLVRTSENVIKTIKYLKNKFEMKVFEKSKFCLKSISIKKSVGTGHFQIQFLILSKIKTYLRT